MAEQNVADGEIDVPEVDPVKGNIYQRLHGVMRDIEYIQKTPKKPGMQYSYVAHDTVTAKTRPKFLKHGIVYYISQMDVRQDGNRTEVRIEMSFVNIDDPEDRIVTPSVGYGVDTQDKGPGKAVTYACKIAILKTLGLETGDASEPIEDVDSVQDSRADYRAKPKARERRPRAEPAPVAYDSHGEGLERGACNHNRAPEDPNKPWVLLREAMRQTDNYPALKEWWRLNEYERRRLDNGETVLLFIAMMKHGFDKAADLNEIGQLLADHDNELEALKLHDSEDYQSLVRAYHIAVANRKLKRRGKE